MENKVGLSHKNDALKPQLFFLSSACNAVPFRLCNVPVLRSRNMVVIYTLGLRNPGVQ